MASGSTKITPPSPTTCGVKGKEPPRISVHVNGQFVQEVRLAAPGSEIENQISVRLAGRVTGPEAVIKLVAEDDHGASDPAEVTVRLAGAMAPKEKPRLFVLAIGVGDYKQSPPRDLDYADDDANDVAAAFLEQKGRGLYRDVKVEALVDDDASETGIIDGLNRVLGQIEQNDVAIVFLAGHGKDLGSDYYFLPWDADVSYLEATGLSKEDLLRKLGAIYRKGAKVLAFIDTCYAGAGGAGERGGGPPDVNRLAQELSDTENGVIVFTSSTGGQVAVENPKWENGAFTEALLEGLSGKARPGADVVRISDLGRYLEQQVKKLTDGKQTPQVFWETKLTIDPPIAMVR